MTTVSQLDAFLAILTEKAEGKYLYSYEMGRVYAKVIITPARTDHHSVYCFIRLRDGAIFKAASWKAPAIGVRAWLAETLANPASVHYSSGWLYRYA